MEMRLAELERLLISLFRVSETQREALTARFKNLRLLGGIPTVPDGGWSSYDLDAVLKIVLTFEMVDLGYQPTRVVRMLRTHWERLQFQLAFAWADLEALEAGKEIELRMWGIIPHALTELGAAKRLRDVDVADKAGRFTPEEFLEWNRGEALKKPRHVVFVNLPHLLGACCEAFALTDPESETVFRDAMRQYSAAAIARYRAESV